MNIISTDYSVKQRISLLAGSRCQTVRMESDDPDVVCSGRFKRVYDLDGCSQDNCSMDVHRSPQHMTESDTGKIGFLQFGFKIDWKLLVTLIGWTHQDLKEVGACLRLSQRIIFPNIAVK